MHPGANAVSVPAFAPASHSSSFDQFHRKARRKISAPAEVLPCWRAGIETEVNNPAIRDALWFGR